MQIFRWKPVVQDNETRRLTGQIRNNNGFISKHMELFGERVITQNSNINAPELAAARDVKPERLVHSTNYEYKSELESFTLNNI